MTVGSDRAAPPPTRRGISFDQAASALQKAIRRGDETRALRFAVELELSGFEQYVWRRLMVICSEDIGLAEPQMPAQVHALHEMAAHLRKKASPAQQSWRLMLVHAVLLVTRARKSRIVDHALIWASREADPLDVPDWALDKHTKAGRKLGRGEAHFWDDGSLLADHETGELSHAPHLPDPYRERAMALRSEVRSTGRPETQPAHNLDPSSSGQLPIDEEDR